MSFHEELRKVRIERGLKQKEVAQKIGVSEPTYSMYEKGTREPNVSKLRELASALEVSSDQLLGLTSNSQINSEISANTLFLSNFSDEELQALNKIFNASYLIPPKLLLQVIMLYVNQSTATRAEVITRMLEEYAPNAVAIANMPQPNIEQIQRAVALIMDYIDSYK